MKCKLFEGNDKNKLEQDINIWLSSNDGKIKISRVLQSTASYFTVVSIWYYEIEDKTKHKTKYEFDGIEVI